MTNEVSYYLDSDEKTIEITKVRILNMGYIRSIPSRDKIYLDIRELDSIAVNITVSILNLYDSELLLSGFAFNSLYDIIRKKECIDLLKNNTFKKRQSSNPYLIITNKEIDYIMLMENL